LKRISAYRIHTKHKESGGKAATAYFIRNVALIIYKADSLKLFSKIGICNDTDLPL